MAYEMDREEAQYIVAHAGVDFEVNMKDEVYQGIVGRVRKGHKGGEGWCEELGLLGFEVEEWVIGDGKDEGLVKMALRAEMEERKRVWGRVLKKGLALVEERRMGLDERDERPACGSIF